LGLTASYPLTNRWSLQTGLVYTRLHADFETVTQQRQFSQEQAPSWKRKVSDRK